ncbi:MAG: hypothetical protein GY802_07490, partial [Gammaproteobacteria bacterium]|nr:hypothetical protein [Gammaproteobacteria bacterium]
MGIESKLRRLPVLILLALSFVGIAFSADAAAAGADSLKLIVYGATGRVGSRVVE